MTSNIQLPFTRQKQALWFTRFADNLRANENWVARNLRLLGVIR
jgi:hypothetical protein